MSCTLSDGEHEDRGCSPRVRMLYAACGLVYRAGCGPSEHVLALAKALSAHPRIELTVLFSGITGPPPTGPFVLDSLEDRGLETDPGKETDALVLGVNPVRYLSHRRRVLAYAAEAVRGHEVLIERMWAYGGILSGRFEAAGRTVILEENGPVTWMGGLKRPGDLLRLIYLYLSRIRLKACYRIGRAMVVQTPNLAERMTREFDVAEARLEVVENGVDLDRFAESRPMKTTGSAAPLILVYAGALDGNHDLRPLARAALQRPDRVEVRILGSGPLRSELEDMITKAKKGRIRLLGRVAPRDVVEHLGEADLGVAPYSPETRLETGFQFSPLKLMEYAAAGRPAVVAGPAPTEAGVVAPDVNGFFIPNETEAWLQLFDRLPGRDVLSRMGWKGRERVLRMGWDQAAKKIVRIALDRSSHPTVAAMPYSNTENRYIGLLHDHLGAAEVRLLDPGNLRLRWLEAHAGCVDLIHLHWPESHYQFPNPVYSFLKWLYLMRRLKAAERLKYRIVWTVHNLEAHDRRHGVLDRMVRRHLLQRAGIILLGEGALTALERRFGASPAQPSTVIRHGHYIGCYGETLDQAHCRKALGLPLDKKVYLFFGSMRRYKGVDHLARIFARIRLPDAILVAAGKVPDRDMESKIQSISETSPDRILFFPGFIPDARAGLFLQAADFLVLPYREIHMSGTLLASLSYARPAIAPDLGLIRDYLPEGAGLLYDSADPEGLERALRQSEEKDALEMGRQGLAFAERLDWAEIARAHRRFYARLTGKDCGKP